MVDLLLDAGASVHSSASGTTPLMAAVKAGCDATVEKLLSRGAVARQSELVTACQGHSDRVVAALLRHGVVPDRSALWVRRPCAGGGF